MKNKFSYFLIALVMAFGLWTYVVTTVSPESEATFYNIPVEWEAGSENILKQEERLMVLSDSKPTVTLRLRGNRSDLDKLKNSDITVVADLGKINHAGEQTLNYNVYFTGNGGAFEIVDQNPSVLKLQIVEWDTKDVPVVVNYTGSLGLDYIAFKDEVMPNPNSITISGPKSVVDQVAQARVDVDLTNQTETISQSYRATLCNSKGEPLDVGTITADGNVRLTLRILRVKELLLEVTPSYGGGVTPENSSWSLNYTTIKVAGSEKILAALPDVLNLGRIDLSGFMQNSTVNLPITGGMLQGAENLSGITEVEVSITVPERITRRLEITDLRQIEVEGLPENMALEFVTQKVSVTLIGRADQINAITAEDLTIIIDASDAEINDYQVLPTNVELSSKYPDVQATIDRPITVNITAGGQP